MKKTILVAIAIAIVGLLITSAASFPISKSTEEENELTVTLSNLVPQKIQIEFSTVEEPVVLNGAPIIADPAFADVGDQLHPGFGRAGSIHMASYRDDDLGNMIWTYSVDDGATYEPGIYYELSGDYPSIKVWDGQRFFGTFVTDYLDLNGGAIYLYEINDATQLEDTTLNPLTYWDFSDDGWFDMLDADIACDSSQNTWEWGVSSYVISSTWGDGYTDGPTVVYSDEETSGSGWISWYYLNGCDHTDISIDNSIVYSYAVYDWEDPDAGYFKLLCRVQDFALIETGYDSLFELDYGGNTINPAVAAGDGNIVILAENDDAANKDIVCFYGTSLSSMSSSVVVNTGDDEMYPDVRHVDGQKFVCTYVKNNDLYSLVSTDGGATWTDNGQVNDNDGCVVEEYKTSDLCEAGAKAMWEEDCGDDIDIYIGDVLANDPPGAPDIDGPTTGDVGTAYPYDFTAIDPDGDDVKYFIDWGDGETEWTSFAASGTPVTASHTWTIGGDLVITAYAEDVNGLVGPEETLPINMPRNRAHVHTFLQWVLERFPNAFPIFRCVFGL